MRKTLLATALLALMAVGSAGCVAEESHASGNAVKDAWLTGRIESMYLLNPHLSPFEITTVVEGGVVHLMGTVESDIDRDLAGQLAGNIEGVAEVDNDLKVDANARSDASPADEEQVARRDFGSWVDDTTTTAAVKSRLIGNANTKGLQIDVDTQGDIVTLSGRVQTAEEKALAEQIARASSDVADVTNNLVVDPS
jgi:hyperosmotically inducible periplasmic protein